MSLFAKVSRRSLPGTLLLLAIIGGLSCQRFEDPTSAYEHAKATFVHGDFATCQLEAERGYRRFRQSNPEWAWKFKLLEAEALLWRGMYPEVLQLLSSDGTRPTERNSLIRFLALQAPANARVQQFTKASEDLEEADRLCAKNADQACGEVLRAHGVLEVQQGDTTSASNFFQRSLSFARGGGDRMLEATALLNLGLVCYREGRLDEAIDWSEAAYKTAAALDASFLTQKATGNLGWAYYKLGDSERALKVFLEAEDRAAQLGDVIDGLTWARGAGRIYADLHHTEEATRSYRKALDLATKSNAKDDINGALLAMAWLALQTANIDDAAQYAERARQTSINHVEDLYAALVQGQVAERRDDSAKAQTIFASIESDKDCSPPLRWETEHSLARLYEDRKQPDTADREYRAALAIFEEERTNVRHEDFQISFLTNAARIYDDYIHFLITRGKTHEALRWADNSRARTLLEGLSLPSNDAQGAAKKKTQFDPPVLPAQTIAAHAKGLILYYWLGEAQSYLWAITPRETKLFTLPAGSEIEARVQRYRQALTKGPTDVLQSANEDGRWLYRTLVAPAQALLPKDTRVFVIPDGNLNNLNFETLIVPDPAPHYWIEDAVITDSSSLRLLSASFSKERKHNRRGMLLIGNSIAPNDQYPALPNAPAQVQSVAKHFTDAQLKIFSGADATPAAYLSSHPEQFSHIHFVAHGTASRLSPLDSAIVLSKNPNEVDSFKLYARDIIRHPLHADIVTISACYGAGERAYSGEGLVGLAWAFLRAGAHNVIAGLWEVTDVSTQQMMDRFYDELDKGTAPDAALRAAKLSLLHGNTFRNPFYWAPFQLYAGS
jgi:CHAT domain-containing protein